MKYLSVGSFFQNRNFHNRQNSQCAKWRNLMLIAASLSGFVLFPVLAWAQNTPNASDASTEHAPPDGPFYPGAPKGRTRLQGTLGDYVVRFYGTILLNVSISDTVQAGQDVPLWPLPGNSSVSFPDGSTRRAGAGGDTIFTARQSILGLQVSPKTYGNGWNASGLFEMDFFGSRPVDPTFQSQNRVFNQPRLRRGYLQLDRGEWRIVAGQDKMILAPLDPISYSHVAIPLGASAGDLWAWLPQIRVENRHKIGKTTTLFQAGILRPSFGDQRLNDQNGVNGSAVDSTFSGFGERSNKPFYQARMAITHPDGAGNATIGVSGHYGREQIGANREIDSWATALDITLPIAKWLIFRGEGFAGSNLVSFDGGIIQGVGFVAPVVSGTGVITTPAKFSKIASRGGWGELIIPVTSKDILYGGAGTDDPKDSTLLPGSGRTKNSFVWASYFRRITTDVTFAFEWSFWDFQTRTFTTAGLPGPRATSGRGNVYNIALAYTF